MRTGISLMSVYNEKLIDELAEKSPVAVSQAKMLCHIADTHLFTNVRQIWWIQLESP